MCENNFARLLQYDYFKVKGFVFNKLILLYIFMCGIVSIIGYRRLHFVHGKHTDNSLIALVSYFEEGISFYFPNRGKMEIPYEWIFIQIIIMLLVTGYISSEFSGGGEQSIIRLSSFGTWWISKVVIITFLVILTYIVFWSESFIVTVLFGVKNQYLLNAVFFHLNGYQICVYALFPVIVSCVASYFQCALEVSIGQIQSMIVMISFMLASIYWRSYIFISDFSMVKRISTNQFSEEIYLFNYMMGALLIYLVGVSWVVIRYLKKRDILIKTHKF